MLSFQSLAKCITASSAIMHEDLIFMHDEDIVHLYIIMVVPFAAKKGVSLIVGFYPPHI